jgi:hypothetical protein
MGGVGNVSRLCPVADFMFRAEFWHHTVSLSKTDRFSSTI